LVGIYKTRNSKAMKKQFGGKITKSVKRQLEQSPNWGKKSFENLEFTKMDINFGNMPKLFYENFFKTKGRAPKKPIAVEAFDKSSFLAPYDKAKFIWYGHSVVLMNIQGTIILIDPMLGPDASPIAPFKTKRFSENTLGLIDDFPDIDILLLTHDHYDHLDLASIKKLKGKVDRFWVALGSKRHFVKWGVQAEKVKEFDWWDKSELNGIEITFTPTRHFAGRGVLDRNKTLWGGWAIKSSEENIYFSGDGGYGNHFKMIGEKLGPFDFGFMECGQYHELWRQIHMFPDEAVKASQDVKAKQIMPVHWAGFALALHHWKTPVEDFLTHAEQKSVDHIVPKIGEVFSANQNIDIEHWWRKYE